jgi:hypothetical protein
MRDRGGSNYSLGPICWRRVISFGYGRNAYRGRVDARKKLKNLQRISCFTFNCHRRPFHWRTL